jgi:hypothetical protein
MKKFMIKYIKERQEMNGGGPAIKQSSMWFGDETRYGFYRYNYTQIKAEKTPCSG